MILKALNTGRNVLVDGSLRDSYWYHLYITNIRIKYSKVKVAILYVSCKIETALKRAKNRALITGRVVPEEIIIESYKQIAHSIEILTPITSFVAQFTNEDNTNNNNNSENIQIPENNECLKKENSEPQLLYAKINENDLIVEHDLCILPTDSNWRELFHNIWKMDCSL